MTRLEDLGRRRRELVAELAEVEEELVPEILAAVADGRSLRWIAERTGQSHQTVKNIVDRNAKKPPP